SSITSTATPSTLSSSHQTDTERALSPTPSTNSTNDRICPFSIALLLLLLQSFVVILLSCLPPSLSGILSLGMALFVYEVSPLPSPPPLASSLFQWISLHLPSLTRRRRPFFDEVNILQTYQPRARTMGHLFIPDPPTPAASDQRPERTKEDRDAFTAARDAVGQGEHYENQAIEAAAKKAEIDRFLQSSAGSSELIPTSKRIDFSKMTIAEIIEKRRKEKAEEGDGKGRGKTPTKEDDTTSPKDKTETCGVIKRENL
ncbi:hypothetical protein PMAYCL1PPCAC_02732, partial [Pristionchus mayeri]